MSHFEIEMKWSFVLLLEFYQHYRHCYLSLLPCKRAAGFCLFKSRLPFYPKFYRECSEGLFATHKGQVTYSQSSDMFLDDF